ncbi:MAG: alpha/beta fold hydrolase [Betaproteobacteria bacterium]|nr:alpha/beta fold hydrolase [Betaproteobacteria bacterium]
MVSAGLEKSANQDVLRPARPERSLPNAVRAEPVEAQEESPALRSSTAFVSPWWLLTGPVGSHLQTAVPFIVGKPAPPNYRRERWDTAPHGKLDGDFIDVDRLDGEPGKPILVVFHGLEGDSNSQYALNLMMEAKACGWSGIVAHFRGCSGEMNRLPRAYHSGDAAEIDWIVRRVKAENPHRRVFVAAISLGGNATLKWLGEQGSDALKFVDAVATVSAPVDLMAAGNALGEGFCRYYTWRFLRTMKPRSLAKLRAHPGIFDESAMLASKTLREFDNVVTAPLHGFKDTDDYWTRASSKPGLVNVRVPTLLLNAQNDPFLPAWALPGENEVSRDVLREFPRHGGHVGFLSAKEGTRWMARRVMRFFEQGR